MKDHLPSLLRVAVMLTIVPAMWVCRSAGGAEADAGAAAPAAAALPTRDGLATLPGDAPAIPDKVPHLLDYRMKLADEKFYLYVPPNYRGTEPFGLLVFINSGDEMTVPADWKSVLARRKLLYIAPQKVGNAQFVNRRAGLAVMGLCKMTELCRVDPNRVFVTGISGGARVACLTAFAHPRLVRGVLPMCGADYPAAVPKVKATRDDEYGVFRCDPNLVQQARQRVGFALITGPKDFRHGNILDICDGGFRPNKFRVKLFDVPGMGHQIASGAVIDQALDWIERSAPSAKPQDKPAAGTPAGAGASPPAPGPAAPAASPDDPEAQASRQVNLAENYRRAGMKAKALDILRAIIKDYPDTAAAKRAKESVKQLEAEAAKAGKS